MQSNYKPTQIAAMLSRVDKGAKIGIDNGWTITAGGIGGYRLLVPDDEQTGPLRRDLAQLGVVAHDTPLGYELEIPRATATSVIQSIAVGCDISLTGTTTTTAPAQAANTAEAAYTDLPMAACK
jgi:hypothetical protein